MSERQYRPALGWRANQRSPLGDALRVIRLRHDVSSWISGRWIHVSVARRVRDHAQRLDHARRSRAERPWHPDEGRESPREELKWWRESPIRYAYPGWMAHHKDRGALTARPIYCVRAD